VVSSLLLTENSGWANHVTAIQKISPAKIIAIKSNMINGAARRRTFSRTSTHPSLSYPLICHFITENARTTR
jgi:hypothetical protein